MDDRSGTNFKERRALDSELSPVGSYTPGIKRLETEIHTQIELHDEELEGQRNPGHISGYKLLEHSISVSRVMSVMGEERGRNLRDIELGRVAGLLHDIGKLDPTCHIYRLNEKFTPGQKAIIDTHADLSADLVLRKMPEVREIDRAFLADLHPIIRFHHQPWLIENPFLQEIGFDLKFADFFISLMENRHRPGLSQFQAIDAIEQIFRNEIEVFRFNEFSNQVESSFKAIKTRYGIDLNKLI